jgi:hypothetical protein
MAMQWVPLLAGIMGLCLVHPAGADELYVGPGETYAGIQDAIDAAADGDVITVAEGTYEENIDFGGKDIILTSTDPDSWEVVSATVIDGGANAAVVTFAGTESSACQLVGFLITNGLGTAGPATGGGIDGRGTLATITKNIISGNVAGLEAGRGGGVSDCDGLLEGNTITANTAEGYRSEGAGSEAGYGGGLYGCDGTVRGNTISGNTATGFGGGMAMCGALIEENEITLNRAVGADPPGPDVYAGGGGGLYGCDGAVYNNTITLNEVEGALFGTGGGGLNDCDGMIERNVVGHNVVRGASAFGGGMNGCDGVIRNNMVFGNLAHATSPGGAACGGGLLDCVGSIEHNTIADNTAQGSLSAGGGMCYTQEQTSPVVNCILWNNTAGVGPQLSGGGIPTFCCIQGYTGAAGGNISENPSFVDAGNDDYHLEWGSPCVDAALHLAEVTEDFDGDARGYNGSNANPEEPSDYDIGADEWIGRTLTISVIGTGSVQPSAGTHIYPVDHEAILVAQTTASGWEFDRWEGDASGADNPLHLTMDTDKTVTAVFVTLGFEDVDGNGVVNAVDLQLVINKVLGLDIGPYDADVNADGEVNALDVQFTINAILASATSS